MLSYFSAQQKVQRLTWCYQTRSFTQPYCNYQIRYSQCPLTEHFIPRWAWSIDEHGKVENKRVSGRIATFLIKKPVNSLSTRNSSRSSRRVEQDLTILQNPIYNKLSNRSYLLSYKIQFEQLSKHSSCTAQTKFSNPCLQSIQADG